MTININQNLKDLTESILENAETHHFNLGQLPKINEYKTDIREDLNFKEIFVELDKKIHHCLYWFEVENIEKAMELNLLLDKTREELKQRGRVVPVINKNLDSPVLYVGIRRGGVRKYDGLTNISGRIIQHLGYYIKGSTQGLQFVHWAKNTGFDIKLNIIHFEELPNDYLNVIEKLVAFKLRPLCGKH